MKVSASRRALAVFVLLCAHPLCAQAQDLPDLSVSLDADTRIRASAPLDSAVFEPAIGATTSAHAVATFRTGSAKLVLDADCALATGAGVLLASYLYPGAYVAVSDEVALAIRLRRLSLSFDLAFLRLNAGRQIINLGRGTVFSPADIFLSTNLAGTSANRSGVDALRLTMPLGDFAGMEAMGALAQDFRSGTAALRVFGSPFGWDVAALGAWDGKRGCADFTLDFKGDALVGVYGEALVSWKPAAETLVFTGMIGADWSTGDFLFSAEYRFFSDPAAPGSAAALALQWPAAHYAYASCALALGADCSLAVAAIVDPVNWIDVESLSFVAALPDSMSLVVSLGSAAGGFQAGGASRTLSLEISLEASF